MSFAIDFGPDLPKDISEAKLWYESEQPGLGAEFEVELFERFEFIRTNPLVFAVFQQDIRLARVGRFSYLILYRVLGNTVRILAVVHSARRLNKWLKRR